MSMQLRFLGAAGQVTGSAHLLEIGDKRILIDCGMYQERAFLERNWASFPVPPSSIDAVLLTHAHLDHCGLLPKLVRDGFSGKIWATAPTLRLASLVMTDIARIQAEDAGIKQARHAREGRQGEHDGELLYTGYDVRRTEAHFREARFGEPLSPVDGVSVRFLPAGHILGAALLEVTARDAGKTRKLVFSGDLGRRDMPIVPDPAVLHEADYIVLETTYGDRDHPDEDTEAVLADIVNDTVDRGGNLVVPSFAIERAQQLLLHFSHLLGSGRIPPLRVYLDSPMAIDATAIYRRMLTFVDGPARELLRGREWRDTRRLIETVRSPVASRALDAIHGTAVLIAGSGMCTGGRIKQHLKANISRPESTVLFTGYQAEGTLGREIVDGAREVRIGGESYPVRARIAELHAMSAHADRRGLLAWLGGFAAPPRKLFLVHGEASARQAFADTVAADLGWPLALPQWGDVVTLD